MPEYKEEDMLMLSGIQHIAFCERQWALIHLEQVWAENHLTVEGDWLHRNVDDSDFIECRKETISLHSVNLVSWQLGLYGISDVIELKRANTQESAVTHPSYPGYWHYIPIEYKRGKPKADNRDEVQLCAQAICLEEMYNINIPLGYLYYGETRHRVEIDFNDDLRSAVKEYALKMHELYQKRLIPTANYKASCKSCSLFDICMPKIFSRIESANSYLTQLDN
ncbi:MAG: CRISPR-associated protein Cas4 [Bacteroidales bacterium]